MKKCIYLYMYENLIKDLVNERGGIYIIVAT